MTKKRNLGRLKPATVAAVAGRHPEEHFGVVNPPVYHASTILYRSAAAFRAEDARYTYGSRGTPTTEALEQAIAALEGADGCRLTGSGRSAITLALLAVLGAGDHLLVADNVYGPTRAIVDRLLTRMGIEIEYFDPLVGENLSSLLRDNTRAVYLEAPGSLTFEMADVPAIARAAHAHGALVLLDNTWATPLYFKPFDHGVDISIHAATKYIVGHSDANVGAVTGVGEPWDLVDRAFLLLRPSAGADDVYLAQRGIRTMPVRLAHQMRAGLDIARWLEARAEVSQVLHPALESDPGHAVWTRDFTGAASLFSIVLHAVEEPAVNRFLDTLELFGIGASWGGYESLAMPFDPAPIRTATTWKAEGPAIRFHIGLEDVDDLKTDLDRGFAALSAANG